MAQDGRLNKDFDLSEARKRCNKFRKRILNMSQQVTALHIGGSYSCLEIVDAVYFGMMRSDESGIFKDTFILSKGHGSLAQYTVLEELGILSSDYLDEYGNGGRLGTHPDIGIPGIQVSSGSLGHGLAIGMGMAFSENVFVMDRQVFIVMSDGELQVGSVWESMMLAPTMGLSNVIGFLDLNDYQSFGPTSLTHPNFYPVADKIRAFGWECFEVDGHNSDEIYNAFLARSGDKPTLIVCKTTKGKGISYMENEAIWHYRSPSPEEYAIAMNELGEAIL